MKNGKKPFRRPLIIAGRMGNAPIRSHMVAPMPPERLLMHRLFLNYTNKWIRSIGWCSPPRPEARKPAWHIGAQMANWKGGLLGISVDETESILKSKVGELICICHGKNRNGIHTGKTHQPDQCFLHWCRLFHHGSTGEGSHPNIRMSRRHFFSIRCIPVGLLQD